MTIRIANNQIHIDWKLALTSVSLIITTTWGAAWFIKSSYDEYLLNQEKTNTTLIAIQKELSIKLATDSVQTSDIRRITHKFDSMALMGIRAWIPKYKHQTEFYIEKVLNGHLILTEVKQD